MSLDVVIVPVIPFSTVVDIFGARHALAKYEALVMNLSDVIPSEYDAQGTGLILVALNIRKNIIAQNDNLVMPIPVLRLCILHTDEKVITEPSIQSTSHSHIPIFVSKLALSKNGVPSHRAYVTRECTLEGREGYYIIDTSDAENVRRVAVKGQTTYLSCNYLCGVRGNYESEFGGSEIIYCKTIDDITFIYSGNGNIWDKVMKVAEKRSTPCVIHVCSDFTVRDSGVAGNGVKCITWLIDMCCDSSVYVTEAASYYISNFNKDEYASLNVKTIGQVYLKN